MLGSKNHLENLLSHAGIPCDTMWYDKNSKTNLAKVATYARDRRGHPRQGQGRVPRVARQHEGRDRDTREGYAPPMIKLVLVDYLMVNCQKMETPMLFFIGQMFVTKVQGCA